METRKYPALILNKEKLYENAKQMVDWCEAAGIMVAGVVKGFDAIREGCEAEASAGVKMLASSRLEHLREIKKMGLQDIDGVDMPTLLIRMPMMCEIDETIDYADYSLNSEIATLDVLNEVAAKKGRTHNVILMTDLGDLREGWINTDELVAAAVHVEHDLGNLHLAGIGTNLGCVGSVIPNKDKMEELVHNAELVESAIGRRLEIISGGATSSLAPLFDGVMPDRVNMLRIGEAIPQGCNASACIETGIKQLEQLHGDAFTLAAQIVELNVKPTYPIGEIGTDAFGRKKEYIDRGNRLRVILAVGLADYGDTCDIIPQLEGATIWGASSDHTILDIEDTPAHIRDNLKIGDIVSFELRYGAMLHLAHNDKTVHQYT